jgi:squalene-hopene/tetraprenyl-beta-curcumene cyclase
MFRDGRDKGVVVRAVTAGSPAEQAGLREGDVVVEVRGKPLAAAADLARELKALKVGDTLDLAYRREGAAEPAKVAIVAVEKDVKGLARRALENGLAWLAGRQLESGAWPHFDGPADQPSAPVTALALRAFARQRPDVRAQHAPRLEKAAAYLVSLIDERGSIGQPGAVVQFRNYSTALALAALVELDAERYREHTARLRDFLVAEQVAEPLGFSDYDWTYGAWNYSDRDLGPETLRAEMSITSYVLDGLHMGGLPADHEAFKRALTFLGRCQNIAERAPAGQERRFDGGFGFSPRDSKAGMDHLPTGDPIYRSYGSATADGLRSLLYAGKKRGDPAVEAAAAWIAGRFDVGVNPGFAVDPPPPVPFERGILFYYYHSIAEALAHYGEPLVATPGGKPVAWAPALADHLALRQKPDGSWANPVNVMNENDPVLATSFALIALRRCLDRLESSP